MIMHFLMLFFISTIYTEENAVPRQISTFLIRSQWDDDGRNSITSRSLPEQKGALFMQPNGSMNGTLSLNEANQTTTSYKMKNEITLT
jgi:hypothetical protein